jgi:hypothetical protein
VATAGRGVAGEALPYFERWLPPSRKREQFTAWRDRYAVYFERREKFHDLRSWDAMARRGGGGGILRGSLPDVPTLAGLLIVPDQAGYQTKD